MQRSEILDKRKKEVEKKKNKPSVYDLPMFTEYPKPAKNPEKIFNLKNSQKEFDIFINGDSRDMKEINSNVVSLIITSPPYNVNKGYGNYDDSSNLEDYLEYLDSTWNECYRVLRPGGRLCVNIANIGRSPYLPLTSYITQHLIDIGFFMRGHIIWDKAASVGVSTAWGSYMKPSNPSLRDVHEYILVFSKISNKLKKASDSGEEDITKEEFLEFGKSIWNMITANPKTIGHPAPFPLELPYRLIKLYTYPGDLVLDPFMGSGSTCISAKNTGRHWIGYDIDESYIKLAEERINQ